MNNLQIKAVSVAFQGSGKNKDYFSMRVVFLSDGVTAAAALAAVFS